MSVKRGSKAESRVKLTDALINYSKSGKTDKIEWQKFNNTLTKQGGVIRDSELIGLQISLISNKLSFRYSFRFNGIRKNITLGTFPLITTAQARQLAKDKSLSIANGIDPLAEKHNKRASTQNTLALYLKHDYFLHMTENAIAGREYIALIKNGFPDLLKKPLTEINKTDLVKWLQNQKARHIANEYGYSSSSIIKRYSALKTLMSHALRNQVIKKSPFDLMDKLSFNKDETTAQRAKRSYLTIEQQQNFLASLNDYEEHLRQQRRNSIKRGRAYLQDLDSLTFASHHKPMLIILYYMGMRSGDVMGLEWSHIIDNPFSCNITKQLEKTRRKIKKPFILPMPLQVRDALRQWRAQQGNPKSGLVFPSPITEKRLSKSALHSCWGWIKQDAGFHDELQMYTLRHNFISWLVMKNTPLKVVAEMAGHSSIEMIDKHYAHLIEGETAKASQSFSELLTKKQA